MTGMIPTGFLKAFDTTDHDQLLQNVYAIVFLKHTVNWFKCYLSNRSFWVKLVNDFSQTASVSYGLPPKFHFGTNPLFSICQWYDTKFGMSSFFVYWWFMFCSRTQRCQWIWKKKFKLRFFPI